jgi:hypothetical protein
MASQHTKVGPKLKISVPNFKRTDFSGDIEKLGGLNSSSSRKIRSYPRSDPDPGSARQKASAGLSSASARAEEQGYPNRPADGSTPLGEVGSGALFDAWLKSLAAPGKESLPDGEPNASDFLPHAADDGDATAGLPLETFDSPMDYEVHTPEEWLQICASASEVSGKPQAAVLHYVSHEWRMLPSG